MRSRPKAHERQCAAAVDPYIDELFVRHPPCHGDTASSRVIMEVYFTPLVRSRDGGASGGLAGAWRANQQRGPHQGDLSNH